jgi:hypothetical protein
LDNLWRIASKIKGRENNMTSLWLKLPMGLSCQVFHYRLRTPLHSFY